MSPSLNAAAYRLIARSLGRALAYIQHEMGTDTEPLAFRVLVDALIRDMEADNPRFDARRFRAVLEAARMSEYSTAAEDDLQPEAAKAAEGGHDAQDNHSSTT